MAIVIGDTNESLFEVYALDFDDNYHRLASEPSSELERMARKIRRRYKNVAEYFKAVATYNEYMARLAMKHGGPRLFKIKLKNEMIDEFVPPKPRMKNTRINKYMLKHKIVISNMKDLEPSEKTEEFLEYLNGGHYEDFEPTKPTDRLANKLIKEEASTLSAKKVKAITNIDYLEEYFRSKNVVKEEKEMKELPSIKEIMSGKFAKKMQDTTEEDEVVFYKGNYLNRGSVEELSVYQNLGELGWNSLKVMKSKDVSKKVTKILKEKDKKDKNKKKKHKKDDDFIVKIATDNDYDSFSDFEEDMLNFEAANIFK